MPFVIKVRTLTDGGQQPLEIAHEIAAFLGAATRTLDLAQYDFNLLPETAAVVGGAIRAAAERGVAVRFEYNLDHRLPIPVPPDRKSTRLNSSHVRISYAVFCLKKK